MNNTAQSTKTPLLKGEWTTQADADAKYLLNTGNVSSFDIDIANLQSYISQATGLSGLRVMIGFNDAGQTQPVLIVECLKDNGDGTFSVIYFSKGGADTNQYVLEHIDPTLPRPVHPLFEM